jgi:ribosomal protein L14
VVRPVHYGTSWKILLLRQLNQLHPQGSVKKSDIVKAVIVRCAKEWRREDGSTIRFDDNAAVILDTETQNPKGNPYLWPSCS